MNINISPKYSNNNNNNLSTRIYNKGRKDSEEEKNTGH